MINAGEGVVKRETSCAVGGNVNWCSLYGKTVLRFLKKLKLELPYDPAIPLLGIYPEKNMIQKNTCTPMFIAGLFTITKTWKQCKCPSTDEWVRKMWYIYTMEYYSAIKKNEIMPFAATWMDPEIVILSEISQTERKKDLIILLYMQNLTRNDTNEFIYKQTLRLRGGTYGF